MSSDQQDVPQVFAVSINRVIDLMAEFEAPIKALIGNEEEEDRAARTAAVLGVLLYHLHAQGNTALDAFRLTAKLYTLFETAKEVARAHH
jgi:hypothetical protein